MLRCHLLLVSSTGTPLTCVVLMAACCRRRGASLALYPTGADPTTTSSHTPRANTWQPWKGTTSDSTMPPAPTISPV
jgi:hypothetical protein